eukprot:532419_1
MAHLDTTNPFAGGLPPPNPSPSPQPHLDPDNPFFNPNEPDHENNTDHNAKANQETPGGGASETNPFYEEQQAAIEKYKRQRAFEDDLQQQNEEYEQRQQVMQQEFEQREHQLNQQRQSYHNQQYMMQQRAMQQYMMQATQQTHPQFNPPQPPSEPQLPRPVPPLQEPQPPAAFGIDIKPKAEEKAEEKEEEAQSPEERKEAKRQRNRVRAINELITTEITYITKLELLNSLYINPLKQNEKLLKSKAHAILFPQILQTILMLNQKLLISMEKNKLQIGSAMIDFIPYLKMYQHYMNGHEAATRLIKRLRADKNSELCKYLAEKATEQNGFSLESYLILPIQRMPRYELCLREIIKLTLSDHCDMDNLRECFERISAVNKQINIRMKDYGTRQRVYEIEERIINLEINRNRDRARTSKKMQKSKSSFLFNKRNSKSVVNVFDNLPSKKKEMSRTRLVQPSRIFIKQGYLTKVSRKKDIRYLFVLFNDLLIYCSEGMSDKLILHQRIDITDEFFGIKSAVILDDKRQHQNTFEIHSIEKSFLCYAENNKEREEWISAIEKCVDNILRSGISKAHKSDSGVTPGLSLMVVDVEVQDESRILETAPMYVPNDWSDECMMTQCHNKFNAMLLKKRNHCRYCGNLVCDTCCTNTLPHFDPKKRKAGVLVKVCLVCWDKYRVKPLINLEEMHRASKQMNKAKQTTVVEEEKSKSYSFTFDDSDEEWEELYRQYSEPETPGNLAMTIPQSSSPVPTNVDCNVDLFQIPNLPDEKENDDHKIKYDEDIGIVNAIIAANDNLINSMDMSAFQDENGKEHERAISRAEGMNEQHNAVILDEDAEAHESESSDDFAANFENIVIPDSCRANVNGNSKPKDELYSFLESPPPVNEKPKEVIVNVMHLDSKHEKVQQLTLFGFTEQNIKDAWALMKQNKAHVHIVPDHGPLFVETMLDYLNKVQKQRSKDSIMNKYKEHNNSASLHNDEFNDLQFDFASEFAM